MEERLFDNRPDSSERARAGSLASCTRVGYRPAGEVGQPEDGADKSCFACAVGPHEPEGAVAWHRQVDIVDRDTVAKPFGQSPRFDDSINSPCGALDSETSFDLMLMCQLPLARRCCLIFSNSSPDISPEAYLRCATPSGVSGTGFLGAISVR